MGFVGIGHGVNIPGLDLFFANVHLHGGPAPVRRFLPDLIQLICDRTIDPVTAWQATSFAIPAAVMRPACCRIAASYHRELVPF